jgi:hypothetical protein
MVLSKLGEVAIYQADTALAQSLFRESLAMARDIGAKERIGASLDGLAEVAAIEGQVERALVLAGAAAGLRSSMGARPSPAQQELLERTLQSARQALPEEASAAAWAEGQVDQAIAFALSELS